MPKIPAPLPQERLEFALELLSELHQRLERLEHLYMQQSESLADAHAELAWLDFTLRDHFPHWFETGHLDEEDDEES